tara:strand:- start:812 stop:1627 length:816 start_codon:yes stop_codon:yes gene_type:complete
MNKVVNKSTLLMVLMLISTYIFAHEDGEARIEFWKKYYNPKIEASNNKRPSIAIELIKIGSFYQLKTITENFTFTPSENLKNNNPHRGYGKLFINNKYVSRIYSDYFFIRAFPEGNNEIKVILSSNMDHDIALNGNLISDQIAYQFPEYNFAEARAKEHAQATQCEFSEEGKSDRAKLQKIGMSISESSKYLQCRYDSRNSILTNFKNQMTKIQRVHHDAILNSLLKRIDLWKQFENKRVSLKDAREKNIILEDSIHLAVEKHIQKFKRSK